MWNKNKILIIAMISYVLLILLFGNLTVYNSIWLVIATIIMPLLFNFRVKKGGAYTLLIGIVFAFYIMPFGFAISSKLAPGVYYNLISFPYSLNIIYWVLIIGLNLAWSLHRHRIKRLLEIEERDKSENRDSKIDSLLNPISRRFFK